MLRAEKNYDFRKRLCKPHHKIDHTAKAIEAQGCFCFRDGIAIFADGGELASLAARDLCECLKISFDISARITENEGDAAVKILVKPEACCENAVGYKGRRTVITEDEIRIFGYDERGAAQGVYDLEEEMSRKAVPTLDCNDSRKRPAFSPRMVHSGYGMDEFPDDYLSVIAHSGFDAILVFVKDATHSAHGECDFADIVRRASRYGIDVYAYSYLQNFTHPTSEGAKEKYAEIYGGIFKSIPGLRGMVFVGESIEFPSNDPHVARRHYYETSPDGIPDGKISPGWYPCSDYPEWISLVRDSIRAVSRDADVVFWTYNFGFVSREERVALLEKLPTDISLLVTYEMFDTYEMGEGVGMVMDYTVSHVGPSKYFVSEAEVASRRGIRLYAMTNTAGRTWDFGTVPYEPFPHQWHKRAESILESRERYGLSGLMESHHYGFLPSFISRLISGDFTLGEKTYGERLADIAKEFAPESPEKFNTAMDLLSKSIEHYVPSDENQYGPFRTGPSFPLCLCRAMKVPAEAGAHFGNRIYHVMGRNYDDWGLHDPYCLRVRAETEEAKKARALVRSALRELRGIEKKNEKLQRLINLVSFIEKCYVTAIHHKQFYIQRYKLLSATTKSQIAGAINILEKIGRAELKNAASAIPLVRRDSAIGFEASMGYQCDEKALLWKIKQINYMLDAEIGLYKRSVDEAYPKNRYFKFPADVR